MENLVQRHPGRAVAAWAERLGGRDIPVLRETIGQLATLAVRAEDIGPRDIAEVVLDDPLMTVKVLAHAGARRAGRDLAEVETVGRALVLIGVAPFFATFARLTAAEDLLAQDPEAAAGLARVVARARAAAGFALDWAVRRADPDHEEITIAALLHDLAEMLLWCFAPRDALAIRARQRATPGLRSSAAQRQVLGVELNDVQLALAARWRLPKLLVQMMDDHHADQPRVRNVVYAVRLARHAANGWQDPALAADFADVAALLHTTPERVRLWVGAP